jgi:3-hydroxyacyl-CoA dehydrogenase
VGTGVIGRSWAAVFLSAGADTRMYDSDPAKLSQAADWLREELDSDCREGLLTAADAEQRRARIRPCDTLAAALAGARYVQESGPEQIEKKREIYAALDPLADPTSILASSTSAHDMSTIAEGLTGAWRCIVAHPVNPPHIVPVVEVLGGRETSQEVISRTMAFLTSVGQHPVLLKRHVPGFLLNRMQAALVREAVHLVESGVADVDAVDAVIRDGLGLRWALLGPFGVANTNADGGIRQYLQIYGGPYRALMNDLGPTPSFEPEMIERLGRQTDAAEGTATVKDIVRWRDRVIRKFRRLRAGDPHP